jgi:hypothetical protein
MDNKEDTTVGTDVDSVDFDVKISVIQTI